MNLSLVNNILVNSHFSDVDSIVFVVIKRLHKAGLHLSGLISEKLLNNQSVNHQQVINYKPVTAKSTSVM